MIKAIETVYKGYRFRSRLEARWAVFFDTLGVEWEYEPEGFELGRAGRYLPDFWLPAFNMWLEIKPAAPPHDDMVKLAAFARAMRSGDDGQPSVFLMMGQPWPGAYDMCAFAPTGLPYYRKLAWMQCRRCDGFNLCEEDAVEMAVGPHTCGDRWKGSMPLELSTRLMQAYIAARSARFEHGETPQAPRPQRASGFRSMRQVLDEIYEKWEAVGKEGK